jgi:hypothetical protein
MPYKDPEVRRLKARQRYQENKTLIRTYQNEWYQQKVSKDGGYVETRASYYQTHIEDYQSRSASWYANKDNKMRRREKIHGVSFDEMWASQKGLCALGGEPLPENTADVAIDHNHATNIVRGLLCRKHNTGIGHFDDSIKELEKAIKYLKEKDGLNG